MKYEHTRTKHGTVLLVTPTKFAQQTGVSKFHLYAVDKQRYAFVPVIYIEGNALYAHENWPFKMDDVSEYTDGIARIIALGSAELMKVIKHGYTQYAAGKIRGE